jgi:hypothetical protein
VRYTNKRLGWSLCAGTLIASTVFCYFKFSLRNSTDANGTDPVAKHGVVLPSPALPSYRMPSPAAAPSHPIDAERLRKANALLHDKSISKDELSKQLMAIMKPDPPTDDELLEKAIQTLKNGNLAYNTPEKMKTGQTAHVIARIGSDHVTIATLKSGLSADPGTKTEVTSTPVSSKMKMTLKGADFDIATLSSEEQFVAGATPTAWSWDVTPKHSGKLRLHLAAVVELNNLSRDFTSVDRDVAVQVDPVNEAEVFTKENAKWIIGGLGSCIAAAWAWLRRRKKQVPPAAPSWETI